jgi:hypothetical protein
MGEVTKYLKPHLWRLIHLHSQPQQSQGVIAVSILAPCLSAFLCAEAPRLDQFLRKRQLRASQNSRQHTTCRVSQQSQICGWSGLGLGGQLLVGLALAPWRRDVQSYLPIVAGGGEAVGQFT